jgi:alpha-methylacyl-CoA racemase
MGPLKGYRVIEFGGIGPGPMCAMLLADLGADVLRIDRPDADTLGIQTPARFNLLLRGRERIALDLKRPADRDIALELTAQADALIEGNRPGAMERLGLGPDVCLERNPRLIYGRMTGWGQDGPLATAAGHDLNYIALCGALHAIGRVGAPPTPPLNLVADFGGGALYLAFGIVCALLEARTSGRGQVVDAAMVDGAASLMTIFYGQHAAGMHKEERGTNRLDSGAPFYDVYRCADGAYIAVAPIELKFRAEFYRRIGLDAAEAPQADDQARWPQIKARIAQRIAERPRAEWLRTLEGSDACVAPVLSLAEAPRHPHNVARGTFVEIDGIVQPAPAPRFSRTQAQVPAPPAQAATPVAEALAAWGIDDARVAELTSPRTSG